jgi:hypothetical protein
MLPMTILNPEKSATAQRIQCIRTMHPNVASTRHPLVQD